MSFILASSAVDGPRLLRVTAELRGRVQGRDLLRGGVAQVRSRDVIARHDNEEIALAALRRVKAAIAEEDPLVAAAWAAYAKAQRRRQRAIERAATKVRS